MAETLFELSGRQVKLISFNSYSYTGSNGCCLHAASIYFTFIVYCDIIESTVVGDIKLPLLRCVNIYGK